MWHQRVAHEAKDTHALLHFAVVLGGRVAAQARWLRRHCLRQRERSLAQRRNDEGPSILCERVHGCQCGETELRPKGGRHDGRMCASTASSPDAGASVSGSGAFLAGFAAFCDSPDFTVGFPAFLAVRFFVATKSPSGRFSGAWALVASETREGCRRASLRGAVVESPSVALKPQQFGRYLLLDKVASGGMAEVWRAKLSGEQGFQRIYAIKKILPHVAEDTEFITMFTDEALITSSLQHANIGQVYEFSKIGDTFYIGMEYISGKDLKTVWSYNRSRKTTLPIELAAFITQKMSDGLDYAHRRTDNFGNDAGIVHRDVSPQNILLSWDGEVKVIDFGIAKASEKSGRTRPGTLKGKFAYMSPEQIRGLGLDGRADIFAIGVVLYELCTGERGFSADSEFSLLEMVRNVEIKPPTIVNRDIPAELERIIYKALAKDREHRYQTAAELSEDLQRFLISRGKPPNRQDLANYLRTNFTVDFEKERARLEAYKEITLDEVSSPSRTSPGAQGPSSPQLRDDAHDDPTSAWNPGGEDSAFSSSEEPAPPPPQPTGIRPAARTNAITSDTQANKTPANVARPPPPQQPQGGGGRSAVVFAVAAVITLALVAAAAAAIYFLKPFATKGTVVVTVTGAVGGTVKFDDRPGTRAEPSVTIDKVTAGAHTLIVEEPGYVTFTTQIVTTEATPLFPVKAPLRRLSGKLLVSSDPAGAAIFLDGKDTEMKTPATLEVEGETLHEITLKLEDYRDERKGELKAPVSGEVPVRLKLVPETIKITVTSSPSGAEVIENGEVLGTTPYVMKKRPDDRPPSLTLKLKGCEPKQSSIPIYEDRVAYDYSLTLTCK
jgi:serine/threonine protein kinase